MKTEDLQVLINEKRLLVFLETDAQSNKYNQVILDDQQFKIVSDAIGKNSHKDDSLKEGFEMYEVNLSEEEYELPDLESIN